MALNLKKNEKSMLDAWKWLKDANKAGKWVLFDYEGKTFNLQHVGSGDGGLEELTEDFSDGRIMYGAVSVEDPNSGLIKIVFIVWQGLGVPETVRGKCAVHADAVLKFFKGFHVNLTARGESDIDEETVLEKVQKCSGANYSVHKEKPVPSVKQSSPVTAYVKIDPSKEISREAREDFWKKEAEDSSEIQSSEKASLMRAQEVKPTLSAAAAFKKMENERLEKEKELEAERLKRQENVTRVVKQVSSKSSETEPIKTFEKQKSEEFKDLTPGRAVAFKAMFEKKIDEQSDSLNTKPQIIGTRKKWEPVQTKAAAPAIIEKTPEIQPRFTPEPVRESQPPPTSQKSSSVQYSETKLPSPPSESIEPILPPRVVRETTFTVIALYDYDAGDDTEISFKTGDKIINVVKDDDEWWTGTDLNGIRGQLPYNFVAIEGTPEADEALQSLVAETENVKISSPTSSAKVIYDYDAADSDELSIVENEMISILEKRNDGWWVAQNAKGQTGLVPCNFVEE